MDGSRLTNLCDRLIAQLADPGLTRFQLIDMATVLMLVQREIDRVIDVRDQAAADALNTPLHWIREHAHEASVDDLRSHFAAAARAAAYVLSRGAGESYQESFQVFSQERARV